MDREQWKLIKIEDLALDTENPRYKPTGNQREALATIGREQGLKLVKLAEDILDEGLNPSDLTMVVPATEPNNYVVVEGNRRVAALKLLASPQLPPSLGLPQAVLRGFIELQKRKDTALPEEIMCVTFPTRDDAEHWITLKHTGENDGVGVIAWDGIAAQRFRGSSPSLQAVDLARDSPYLDQAAKTALDTIPITNLHRFLGTPEARNIIGVDVIGNKLVVPDEEALNRLAIVVQAIATKAVNVSHLRTKEQRVAYAQTVSAIPLPAQPSRTNAPRPKKQTPVKHGSGANRSSLVPKRLTLSIKQTRIAEIYAELQRLNVDRFTNSCAVLFRVFVEMSVDDFSQRRPISFNVKGQNKEVKLREKLILVANDLEESRLATKPELKGIRVFTSNSNHLLSVDTWNNYVHNPNYNPTAAELKKNWDSIEAFLTKVWQN